MRIGVPTGENLGELDERLNHCGITPGRDDDALLVADLWGNAAEVATQGSD